jgi:hypothetical protein
MMGVIYNVFKETMNQNNPYFKAYNGKLIGIRKWEDLDDLWVTMRGVAAQGWYVYAVGEAPPREPVLAEKLNAFMIEINALLRREHEEDYCGIVYVDDVETPRFVKIYDPNNLGVVCGFSDAPPLPGWTISKQVPVDLPEAFPPPGNRRRWWRRLLGG